MSNEKISRYWFVVADVNILWHVTISKSFVREKMWNCQNLMQRLKEHVSFHINGNIRSLESWQTVCTPLYPKSRRQREVFSNRGSIYRGVIFRQRSSPVDPFIAPWGMTGTIFSCLTGHCVLLTLQVKYQLILKYILILTLKYFYNFLWKFFLFWKKQSGII